MINLFFPFQVASSIVETSKFVMVNPGETVSMFCSAAGNPMNDDLIRWMHNGNTNFIKDSRINIKIEKGKSTLRITNVNVEKDSGEYQCIGKKYDLIDKKRKME